MILADSTFLIDILRKKTDVIAYLKEHPDEILFTTQINVFGLYLGLYSIKKIDKDPILMNKRLTKLEELLSKFQILSFNKNEAIKSAKLLGKLNQIGTPIDFRDGIIAGIALSNGIRKILIKNIDHFKRIENLEVVSY
jgi:predicted nucleic acid-binding protein